jgi:hypothetical protein
MYKYLVSALIESSKDYAVFSPTFPTEPGTAKICSNPPARPMFRRRGKGLSSRPSSPKRKKNRCGGLALAAGWGLVGRSPSIAVKGWQRVVGLEKRRQRTKQLGVGKRGGIVIGENGSNASFLATWVASTALPRRRRRPVGDRGPARIRRRQLLFRVRGFFLRSIPHNLTAHR